MDVPYIWIRYDVAGAVDAVFSNGLYEKARSVFSNPDEDERCLFNRDRAEVFDMDAHRSIKVEELRGPAMFRSSHDSLKGHEIRGWVVPIRDEDGRVVEAEEVVYLCELAENPRGGLLRLESLRLRLERLRRNLERLRERRRRRKGAVV